MYNYLNNIDDKHHKQYGDQSTGDYIPNRLPIGIFHDIVYYNLANYKENRGG